MFTLFSFAAVTCFQDASAERSGKEHWLGLHRLCTPCKRSCIYRRTRLRSNGDACTEKAMRPDQPRGAKRATASQRPDSHAGAIVRAARLAAGLTLAELGDLCGY